MPSDFFERMDELEAMIPDTSIESALEVSQVYAHFQHNSADLKHPNGGQAFYLQQPWEGAAALFGEGMARGLLDEGGLQREAEHFADDGAKMVYDHAPVEFGDLRESGHPTVTVDGATTYDRPPVTPRLSEAELREKGQLRRAFNGPVAR